MWPLAPCRAVFCQTLQTGPTRRGRSGRLRDGHWDVGGVHVPPSLRGGGGRVTPSNVVGCLSYLGRVPFMKKSIVVSKLHKKATPRHLSRTMYFNIQCIQVLWVAGTHAMCMIQGYNICPSDYTQSTGSPADIDVCFFLFRGDTWLRS